METIKRYVCRMGDLRGDAALKRSVMPRRLAMVVMMLAWIFPAMATGMVIGSAGGTIGGLFFVNHLGLLLEMGGDSSGKNWFARGAGLVWLLILGWCLVGIVVRIFTELF